MNQQRQLFVALFELIERLVWLAAEHVKRILQQQHFADQFLALLIAFTQL